MHRREKKQRERQRLENTEAAAAEESTREATAALQVSVEFEQMGSSTRGVPDRIFVELYNLTNSSPTFSYVFAVFFRFSTFGSIFSIICLYGIKYEQNVQNATHFGLQICLLES